MRRSWIEHRARVVGRGRLRKSRGSIELDIVDAAFFSAPSLHHASCLGQTLRRYSFGYKASHQGTAYDRSSPSIDVASGEHRDTAWRRCRWDRLSLRVRESDCRPRSLTGGWERVLHVGGRSELQNRHGTWSLMSTEQLRLRQGDSDELLDALSRPATGLASVRQ